MMERVIAKLYQAQTIGFIKFKIHNNVKIEWIVILFVIYHFAAPFLFCIILYL